MTNEELAVAIAQGRDDLQLQLWEQVRDYVHMMACRAFAFSGGQGGTTVEDLEQEGFIAVFHAVKSFDPEKGTFLSYLAFMLRSAFGIACGYRAGSRHEPLDQCLSLDAPVTFGADTDEETYADRIADPCDPYAQVEERIYNDQLHVALDRAIDRLPPMHAEVIRSVYWDSKTRREIAEEHGVTFQNVSNHLERGIANLRIGSSARELRQFLDERTDYYAGTGAQAFRSSGSAVERMVIRRETLTEKWERMRDSGAV